MKPRYKGHHVGCSLYRVIEGWLSLYQHSTPNRNITNTTHSYDRKYAREKEKRDQTLLIAISGQFNVAIVFVCARV
ncbi:hypothetical protein LSTR_LSTR017049 [Laodelphax striatellus]|uniref:Uncharacterized protein n=1 Tax=Laodelphax striatellus TaxID=195883 RepID=A0A482WM60_LAOST|nr:hypothetical protein LSTR_LSTR017049 [Laodelphax striatellus]